MARRAQLLRRAPALAGSHLRELQRDSVAADLASHRSPRRLLRTLRRGSVGRRVVAGKPARPRLGTGGGAGSVGSRRVDSRLAHGRLPVGATRLFSAPGARGHPDRRVRRRLCGLPDHRRRQRRPGVLVRAGNSAGGARRHRGRRSRGGIARIRLVGARSRIRPGDESSRLVHRGGRHPARDRAVPQVGSRPSGRGPRPLRATHARGRPLETEGHPVARDGSTHFPARRSRPALAADQPFRRARSTHPGGLDRPAGGTTRSVPEQRFSAGRTGDYGQV